VSAVRNIKATQQTDHHYHLGYDKAIITKASNQGHNQEEKAIDNKTTS